MNRDYRSEAKQVVTLAGKSKEFKASAAVIRGAINNVYERLAEDMLRQYEAKAAEMGLTTKQFHDQVATMLLLEAAKAVIRVSKRAKSNPRASRPRIENHSGADIKRQLSLAGQEIKQANAIYRRGDAAQATSMLQRLIFRSGAVNAILNDSTVSHNSHMWLRASGASVALTDAINRMRDTAGIAEIRPEHYKRPGAKRKGVLKERVANPRKPRQPWIRREGKLGGPGYTAKPEAERHRLLARAVERFGYRSALGSLMALLRSHAIHHPAHATIQRDERWLRGAYGGSGSFGPRNHNPAMILSRGAMRPAEWDQGWTSIGAGRVAHSAGGLIERKSGGYRVVLPSGAYALTATDGHVFKSMSAAKRAYFAQKGAR